MNEQQIQDELRLMIEAVAIVEDSEWIDGVETFEEAGVMTNNKGLVIHTADGSTFQVTIVKS
jgi:hypothetical protein